MFASSVALGVGSGSICWVSVPDGGMTVLYERAGAFPDGMVVWDGVVYWTTMGIPTREPARMGEQSLDFAWCNGGLHAVGLDGAGARDVLPAGSITTGKEPACDGAETLYSGDREACRVAVPGSMGVARSILW